MTQGDFNQIAVKIIEENKYLTLATANGYLGQDIKMFGRMIQ